MACGCGACCPPDEFAREPAFDHYPDLPRWQDGSVELTLLAGHYLQHHAPTRLYSNLVGMDVSSAAGGEVLLELQPGFEYAVLPLEGSAVISGETFAADELAYLGQGRGALALTLTPGARALLIGGEPFEQPVVMWWNFVAHTRADIVQAQHDWESGSSRFAPVPGERGQRMTAPRLPWAQV